MPNKITISRRHFLASAAAAGLTVNSFASSSVRNTKPPLTCFSKHLQFSRDYNELADMLAELGFDGTDLTVRRGGHVLPENVERDLPKATEAIRKAGVDVHMITSDISNPDEKKTENVLKTASALGIPYYRIGTWRFERNRGIIEQLNEWKPKVKALAEMNAHYKMRAGYHNHSGKNYIGGSLWEVREMYKDADPEWVGYNFDAAHAVAEGAGGSWEIAYNLIKNQIYGVAVKDSAWLNDPEKGWYKTYPPVGTGMVDWPYVLKLLKAQNFTGPFSMHFEYKIPGEGLEKHKNELKAIRRDLDVFKGMLADAGLR